MSLFKRARTLHDRKVQGYEVRIIGFAPNGGVYSTYAPVGRHQESPVYLCQAGRWWWSWQNTWVPKTKTPEHQAKFEQALAAVNHGHDECVAMPPNFTEAKAIHTPERKDQVAHFLSIANAMNYWEIAL